MTWPFMVSQAMSPPKGHNCHSGGYNIPASRTLSPVRRSNGGEFMRRLDRHLQGEQGMIEHYKHREVVTAETQTDIDVPVVFGKVPVTLASLYTYYPPSEQHPIHLTDYGPTGPDICVDMTPTHVMRLQNQLAEMTLKCTQLTCELALLKGHMSPGPEVPSEPASSHPTPYSHHVSGDMVASQYQPSASASLMHVPSQFGPRQSALSQGPSIHPSVNFAQSVNLASHTSSERTTEGTDAPSVQPASSYASAASEHFATLPMHQASGAQSSAQPSTSQFNTQPAQQPSAQFSNQAPSVHSSAVQSAQHVPSQQPSAQPSASQFNQSHQLAQFNNQAPSEPVPSQQPSVAQSAQQMHSQQPSGHSTHPSAVGTQFSNQASAQQIPAVQQSAHTQFSQAHSVHPSATSAQFSQQQAPPANQVSSQQPADPPNTQQSIQASSVHPSAGAQFSQAPFGFPSTQSPQLVASQPIPSVEPASPVSHAQSMPSAHHQVSATSSNPSAQLAQQQSAQLSGQALAGHPSAQLSRPVAPQSSMLPAQPSASHPRSTQSMPSMHLEPSAVPAPDPSQPAPGSVPPSQHPTPSMHPVPSMQIAPPSSHASAVQQPNQSMASMHQASSFLSVAQPPLAQSTPSGRPSAVSAQEPVSFGAPSSTQEPVQPPASQHQPADRTSERATPVVQPSGHPSSAQLSSAPAPVHSVYLAQSAQPVATQHTSSVQSSAQFSVQPSAQTAQPVPSQHPVPSVPSVHPSVQTNQPPSANLSATAQLMPSQRTTLQGAQLSKQVTSEPALPTPPTQPSVHPSGVQFGQSASEHPSAQHAPSRHHTPSVQPSGAPFGSQTQAGPAGTPSQLPSQHPSSQPAGHPSGLKPASAQYVPQATPSFGPKQDTSVHSLQSMPSVQPASSANVTPTPPGSVAHPTPVMQPKSEEGSDRLVSHESQGWSSASDTTPKVKLGFVGARWPLKEGRATPSFIVSVPRDVPLVRSLSIISQKLKTDVTTHSLYYNSTKLPEMTAGDLLDLNESPKQMGFRTQGVIVIV
eukprot:TRINITY_DN16977_c0_g1_i1.p1 TRINITY_DN16977_c0_g1~~TRINITY_DN16977_c0_g1_i1.p1  ORF type:complete len:1031 (+),score=118.45 TRINITY_DN16977_c0_g1_i1:65-3157(+)